VADTDNHRITDRITDADDRYTHVGVSNNNNNNNKNVTCKDQIHTSHKALYHVSVENRNASSLLLKARHTAKLFLGDSGMFCS